MICADPWDEVARLEDSLEDELLSLTKLRASRIPADAFRGIGVSGPSPTSRRRRDPTPRASSDLGWRYSARTYKVAHF